MKNKMVNYLNIGREATVAYLICLGVYLPLQLVLPGWLQYITIVFFLVIWEHIRFRRTKVKIVIQFTEKMTISTESTLRDLALINESWDDDPPRM